MVLAGSAANVNAMERRRLVGIGVVLATTRRHSISLKHLLHPDHIEPATVLVADFFEVGNFNEAEFGVKRDTGLLIGVDATEDSVVADLFGEFNEFAEEKRAEAFALMFVMQVNGVLDAVAVGLAWMEAAERSPADDLAVFFCDDDGMLGAMRVKPVTPLLRRGGHGLVGTGAVLDVVIVDRVDGVEIGECGWADGNGHEGRKRGFDKEGSVQMMNVEILMTKRSAAMGLLAFILDVLSLARHSRAGFLSYNT
jgi:hypothetical protein